MTALILVPGHMCGAWLYEPLADHAPDAVIADVTQDKTIAAMAERLLSCAPQRFAIAGLSMGGMVAMEVMARAPERVLGACLMDTDPGSARERETLWRQGLLDSGFESYVETFVGNFYRHDPQIAKRLGPLTRTNMLAAGEAVAGAQANALDTRRDMVKLIGGYRGPVEIVVGADDKVCPPKIHEPLAAALERATLTELAQCGHIATLEKPQEVSAVLDRLIRGLNVAKA